ncbi:MAG: sigma-70 family RNA polymerase sigma factor [Caldithrix sp.]|nr:sigma-70 family RNA polymerase sigma factor [Caldithrix sp.]
MQISRAWLDRISAAKKRANDEQLMRQIKRGDRQALGILYERYNQRLYRYLMRMMGGNTEQAADLVQDIFITVLDNAQQFHEDRLFAPWFFRIAHNRCKNEYRFMNYRNHATTNDYHLSLSEETILNHIEESDFRKALESALMHLSLEKRSMFLLRFEEHLTLKDIAKILNLPMGTVKSRLHYTLKQLRKQLQAFNPSNKEVNYDKNM